VLIAHDRYGREPVAREVTLASRQPSTPGVRPPADGAIPRPSNPEKLEARTVANQLAAIYSKLGVRSRRELVARQERAETAT
jgi:hypothetical protein